MRVDPSWFNKTVWVASIESRNSKGDPSYEDPRSVPARVELRSVIVRDASGRDRESTTVVITQATEFKKFDRIWLPGTEVGRADDATIVEDSDVQRDKAGRFVISRAFL